MQFAATSPPELVQQLNTYKGNAKMTIDALTTGGLNMLQVRRAWFGCRVGGGGVVALLAALTGWVAGLLLCCVQEEIKHWWPSMTRLAAGPPALPIS